jgi:hypothetical protein
MGLNQLRWDMKKIISIVLTLIGLSTLSYAAGISRTYETLTTATVKGISTINLTVNGVRASSAFASVEGGDVRCTFNGVTTPTTTAGGSVGHLFLSGTFINITENSDVKGFKCINAVNGSGAVVKVTIEF